MPPAAVEGLFLIRLTWMSDGNGAAILIDEEGNTPAYKMVLRWSNVHLSPHTCQKSSFWSCTWSEFLAKANCRQHPGALNDNFFLTRAQHYSRGWRCRSRLSV